MYFFIAHVFRHVFIYLKSKEAERLFICCLTPTNGHNSQDWTKLNSDVGNSIQVSYARSRDPSIWAIFRCFPRYFSKGATLEEQSRIQLVPKEGAGMASLIHCATPPAPVNHFLTYHLRNLILMQHHNYFIFWLIWHVVQSIGWTPFVFCMFLFGYITFFIFHYFEASFYSTTNIEFL